VGAGSAVSSIQLPFTDIARSEFLVTFVAVGQTLAFVALLGIWLYVAYGPFLKLAVGHAADSLRVPIGSTPETPGS
jgi:hypothetical protein